jgi:hypothetical protein
MLPVPSARDKSVRQVGRKRAPPERGEADVAFPPLASLRAAAPMVPEKNPRQLCDAVRQSHEHRQKSTPTQGLQGG